MSNTQDLLVSTEASGIIFDDVLENSQHIAVIEIVEPQKEYPVGAATDLIINVRCPEGCDLGGGTILIGDESDRMIAEQHLTNFDEGQGFNTTGAMRVQIPTEPGEHTWVIVFFPQDSDSAKGTDESSAVEADEIAPITDRTSHAIVQAEYRFFANTHVTGMTVYREYQPVEVGREYVITVGAECLAGCSLFGQKISVCCEDELLAVAELGEPTGLLSKLYQTAITLIAPDEVGSFELRVSINPDGLGLAHTSNECRHYVTTRLPSQCCLDIKAVDSATLRPLANADIVVRPKAGYPSWWHTDNEGKVRVEVAWGEHEVSASLNNYELANTTITLSEGQDMVELTIPMDYHQPLFT